MPFPVTQSHLKLEAKDSEFDEAEDEKNTLRKALEKYQLAFQNTSKNLKQSHETREKLVDKNKILTTKIKEYEEALTKIQHQTLKFNREMLTWRNLQRDWKKIHDRIRSLEDEALELRKENLDLRMENENLRDEILYKDQIILEPNSGLLDLRKKLRKEKITENKRHSWHVRSAIKARKSVETRIPQNPIRRNNHIPLETPKRRPIPYAESRQFFARLDESSFVSENTESEIAEDFPDVNSDPPFEFINENLLQQQNSSYNDFSIEPVVEDGYSSLSDQINSSRKHNSSQQQQQQQQLPFENSHSNSSNNNSNSSSYNNNNINDQNNSAHHHHKINKNKNNFHHHNPNPSSPHHHHQKKNKYHHNAPPSSLLSNSSSHHHHHHHHTKNLSSGSKTTTSNSSHINTTTLSSQPQQQQIHPFQIHPHPDHHLLSNISAAPSPPVNSIPSSSPADPPRLRRSTSDNTQNHHKMKKQLVHSNSSNQIGRNLTSPALLPFNESL